MTTNLSLFRQLNCLNEKKIHNYVEFVKNKQNGRTELSFQRYSDDSLLDEIALFFRRWIWKPKERRFENVSKDFFEFYKKNIKNDFNQMKIKQLISIKCTLDIINERWGEKFEKNNDPRFKNEYTELDELIKQKIQDQQQKTAQDKQEELIKKQAEEQRRKEELDAAKQIEEARQAEELQRKQQEELIKKQAEEQRRKEELEIADLELKQKQSEEQKKLREEQQAEEQRQKEIQDIIQKENERTQNELNAKQEQEKLNQQLKEKYEKQLIANIEIKVIDEYHNSEKIPNEIPTKVDLKNNFFKFLIEKKNELNNPQYNGLFDCLKEIYEINEKKLKDNDSITRLTANIFNDRLFYKKLYKNIKIDGQNPNFVTLLYLEGLADFYDKIKNELSNEEKEKFNEFFDAYYLFLFSSLIGAMINSYPQKQQTIINIAGEILYRDMLDVQENRKKRGYWMAGYDKHFVSLRYENKDGKLIVGTFNLGSGIDQLNIQNGKIKSETRVKNSLFDNQIDDFFIVNQPDFKDFCKNIVTISSLKGKDEWKKFINETKETLPLDPLQSSVAHFQLPQKSGNCTCRNQWALLKKEFDRLFPKHRIINYDNFKKHFQKQNLLKIKPPIGAIIPLGITSPEADKLNELTQEQIYGFCLSKHLKLSLKKHKKLQRKHNPVIQPQLIEMTFTSRKIEKQSYQFKPICFSLNDLFGDNKKIIFGRQPALDAKTNVNTIKSDTNYYQIPNYFINPDHYKLISPVALILTKDDKGDVLAEVNNENDIIVKVRNQADRIYKKGEKFPITIDILSIEFSNFIIFLN